MSFGELLFLAILALLVFGPRKLPEIARNMAKIMAELRRASNEFRYSLEDEIRNIEVSENTQKRLENPTPPVVEGAIARPEYHSVENKPDAFREDLTAPADTPAASSPGEVNDVHDEARAGGTPGPTRSPAAQMKPSSAISVPWDEPDHGHEDHDRH